MTRLLATLCVCVFGSAVSAGAATITVNAGGDFQAALNAAKPGDTIVLQAGAVFAGSFRLPAKGGTSYITIRSSTSDAQLPAAGVRMSPSYAPLLAKIRSSTAGSAIKAGSGANYWRFQFVEFQPGSSSASETLIEFGAAGTSQDTLAKVPHHLILDRVYIHGDPSYGLRRGVALNSGDSQVINSYISDVKKVSQDTQAICGWNGPGPYLIENNYLEAAAENVMFGGSDPMIPNLVPSNITIRRNYITKPMAWRSLSWTIKNLIELKNAQNVLIEGNIIENIWAAGQQGYGLALTPRNQSGTAPWSVVRNITYQNNILRHMAGGFNISGYDDLNPSQQTSNIIIRNNLAYDISTSYSGSGPAPGRFAIIGNGPKDLTFNHNTIDTNGSSTIFIYAGKAPTGTTIYGVSFLNNLLKHNTYGINGDKVGEGNKAFNTYMPDIDMRRNVMGGGTASNYPTGNYFESTTAWAAEFVSLSGANYQLVTAAAAQNYGTDGKDTGVDFVELNAALTATSTPETTPTPTPPPTTTGSTPYSGTPIALPGTIQFENYDTGGAEVAYHDTTSGNAGGVYRSNSVDIQATTDSGGGYNVGWTKAGEWLLYTVNVTTAATYAFDVRVASNGSGGSFHIDVDGTNKSGTMTVPNTGGWQVWKTITKTGVSLTSGKHVIRVAMDAAGATGGIGNLNWIQVRQETTASTNPTPETTMAYGGTAWRTPGTIQFEDYDTGGSGVAYHDTTAGNQGGVYRSNNVDIQATTDTGGGHNVAWVKAGEWLKYSVNVVTAGVYNLSARVASSGLGGTFHVEVNGVDRTGPMTVPNTGGWQGWKTIVKSGLSLAAGANEIRVVMDTNGSGGWVGNLNWFSIS